MLALVNIEPSLATARRSTKPAHSRSLSAASSCARSPWALAARRPSRNVGTRRRRRGAISDSSSSTESTIPIIGVRRTRAERPWQRRSETSRERGSSLLFTTTWRGGFHAHHRVHTVSLELELADAIGDWAGSRRRPHGSGISSRRTSPRRAYRNPRDLLLCAAAHCVLGDESRAAELERTQCGSRERASRRTWQGRCCESRSPAVIGRVPRFSSTYLSSARTSGVSAPVAGSTCWRPRPIRPRRERVAECSTTRRSSSRSLYAPSASER